MSELLAPAGSREALIAAVQNGADAVYLGARLFNARRGADNFDKSGLEEAVSYCHARGVRVHVVQLPVPRRFIRQGRVSLRACEPAARALSYDTAAAHPAPEPRGRAH